MKKLFIKILSVVLCATMFFGSSYLLCDELEKHYNAVKLNKLSADLEELSQFDGDIENRVIVSTKRKINPLNASRVLISIDKTFLQFDTRQDAEKAVEYYNSLKGVNFAECDKACDVDTPMLDCLDASTIEANVNNIDDAKKLILANYNEKDLPNIKVGVCDSGIQENKLTKDRVVYINSKGYDPSGHGSKVASLILYNTFSNVTIYGGSAGTSDGKIAVGNASLLIDSYVTAGCSVINMSFGSYDKLPTLEISIDKATQKGVLMIAACGNDKKKLTTYDNHYPSGYSNVIGVANITNSYTKSGTSNYGVGVNTSAVGSSTTAFYNDSQVVFNGTSAASPVVSSIAVLCKTVKPSITYTELWNTVVGSSKPTLSSDVPSTIDAYLAVKKLMNKSLEVAQFTYDLYYDDKLKKYAVKVYCDEDIRVYAHESNINFYFGTYNNENYTLLKNNYIYYNEDFDQITLTAFADNKVKSNPVLINASYNNSGEFYKMNSLNAITNAPLDEKVLKVPSEINGTTVKAIGPMCFAGNSTVEEIYLPSTVTKINRMAFYGCPNLKKVYCENVTSIDAFTFRNCESLNIAIIPNVNSLEKASFYNCKRLIAVDCKYNYVATNNIFNGDDNLLYPKDSALFSAMNVENGVFTYKTSTGRTTSINCVDLLNMWDMYYVRDIEKATNKYVYQLFDVNNDNVVNAKDYAIIIRGV